MRNRGKLQEIVFQMLCDRGVHGWRSGGNHYLWNDSQIQRVCRALVKRGEAVVKTKVAGMNSHSTYYAKQCAPKGGRNQ